jgi:hypothetical protein
MIKSAREVALEKMLEAAAHDLESANELLLSEGIIEEEGDGVEERAFIAEIRTLLAPHPEGDPSSLTPSNPPASSNSFTPPTAEECRAAEDVLLRAYFAEAERRVREDRGHDPPRMDHGWFVVAQVALGLPPSISGPPHQMYFMDELTFKETLHPYAPTDEERAACRKVALAQYAAGTYRTVGVPE